MSAATPVRQSGRHIAKPTPSDEHMGNSKESPVKKPRGRSRSPSRSPSRRAKSPSRAKKSPSRSGKSPVRSGRSPPRSAARTLKAQSVETSASGTWQTTATKRSVSRRQSKSPSTRQKSPTRQSQRVMERVEVTKVRVSTQASTTASVCDPKQGGDMVPAETIASKGPLRPVDGYHFGGPLGVACIMMFAPAALVMLNLVCMKGSCRMKNVLPLPSSIVQCFDWQSVIIYTGWLVLQLVLAVILPGRCLEGQTLATGGRLTYKCNGFTCLVMSMISLAVAMFVLKWPVLCVTKKLAPILLTAIVTTFLASIALYRTASGIEPIHRSPNGSTGSKLYNFFVGRELNPRIGGLDLKMFVLMRVGLISWVALNAIYLTRYFKDTGSVPVVPGLVAAFQIFYVCDALWFEETFMTTKATQKDGLGFMMVFGSLAWMPFYFSLSARYLLMNHVKENNYYMLTAVCLIQVVGYVLYRGSNSQKNIFRRNPFDVRLAHMETIPITSKRILSSGWWGLCRHPNYLGDLLMALAWTIPGGFTLLSTSYLAYLLTMLFYRAKCDDEECLAKYGPSWERYCRRIPFRVIPYIY